MMPSSELCLVQAFVSSTCLEVAKVLYRPKVEKAPEDWLLHSDLVNVRRPLNELIDCVLKV